MDDSRLALADTVIATRVDMLDTVASMVRAIVVAIIGGGSV